LDQQKPTPLCFHTLPSSPATPHIDPKKPHKEIESRYDTLTAHIRQFTASINQFQTESRPIFEKVYVQIRKLLFDFFGTSIDVP